MTIPHLLIVLLTIVGTASINSPIESPERSDGAPSIWRCPEQEGANSLYLVSRMVNMPFSYGQIHAVLGKRDNVSLYDIKSAAQAIGLPMRVVQLKPRDVNRVAPLIAYFESEYGTAGRFCVVLHLFEDHVDIILGSTGEFRSVTVDQFKRLWTGHAAIVTDNRDRFASTRLMLGIALIVFTILIGCMPWCFPRGSKKCVGLAALSAAMLFVFPDRGMAQPYEGLPSEVEGILTRLASRLPALQIEWTETHQYRFDVALERNEVLFGFPRSAEVRLAKQSDGSVFFRRQEWHDMADATGFCRFEEARFLKNQLLSCEYTDWPENGDSEYYQPPDVAIENIEAIGDRSKKARAIRTGVLDRFGISIPASIDALHEPIQSAITRRIQSGFRIVSNELAANDGLARIVLESPCQTINEQFVLSSQLNYCVVAYQLRMDGKLQQTSVGKDVTEIRQSGVYFPKYIEETYWTKCEGDEISADPQRMSVFLVTEMNDQPEHSVDLETNLRLPGTTVYYSGENDANEVPCSDDYLEAAALRDMARIAAHSRKLKSNHRKQAVRDAFASAACLVCLVCVVNYLKTRFARRDET